MDWRGGNGMQDILSLALGFLQGGLVKKGETVTGRFRGFFGTDVVASAPVLARTIPSW